MQKVISERETRTFEDWWCLSKGKGVIFVLFASEKDANKTSRRRIGCGRDRFLASTSNVRIGFLQKSGDENSLDFLLRWIFILSLFFIFIFLIFISLIYPYFPHFIFPLLPNTFWKFVYHKGNTVLVIEKSEWRLKKRQNHNKKRETTLWHRLASLHKRRPDKLIKLLINWKKK